MRCYFIRNGHIISVEELPGLTKEEATIKSHQLYLVRKSSCDGFEVWDRTRFVVRHPTAEGRPVVASSGDGLDDAQIRFHEAHGGNLFRQGKPRALLEFKSPNIRTVIDEAQLRGYDRAKETARVLRSHARTK